jgi:hypothetical protein
VKKQEWTAICIDFLIVVLGVFVGIQVSNWNEARSFDALERDHLRNLRSEIEKDIEATTARRKYYAGVNAAGERALAFLDKDQACAGQQCWRLLVDFFHASQWVDVGVAQTTFTEMVCRAHARLPSRSSPIIRPMSPSTPFQTNDQRIERWCVD